MASYQCIPECEVIEEGDGHRESTREEVRKRFERCKKTKDQHAKFIPVNEFGMEHLPQELRTKQVMRDIKRQCNLTVKVEVRHTSLYRPDTYEDGLPYPWSESRGSKTTVRFGTGLIIARHPTLCKIDGQCPCPLCECSASPKMRYWKLVVKTSTHVLFDDAEAKCAEFECFFDTDDREGVGTLYGLSMIDHLPFDLEHRVESDRCFCVCFTHDEELTKRLISSGTFTLQDVILPNIHSFTHGKSVLVSHPHGGCKKVTVGELLYNTVNVQPEYERNTPIPLWDGTMCRLPMLPWAQDGGTQSCDLGVDYIRKHLEYTRDPLASLINDIRTTMNAQLKIEYLIFVSACDVYNSAVEGDYCYLLCDRAGGLLEIVNLIIHQRLRNIRKRSQTKHIELIDIGWLLFKCYLLLVVHLMKDVICEPSTLKVNLHELVNSFNTRLLMIFPEIREHCDPNRYVFEKSRELMIKDQEHHDYNALWQTVIRILLADDIYEEPDQVLTPDFIDLIEDLYANFMFSAQRYDFIVCSLNKYETLYNTNAFFLQPGCEFKMPSKMSFTLPADTKYAFRVYPGTPQYFMFPPGTKFHLSLPDKDTPVEIPMPVEAEFMNIDMTSPRISFYNYNIDTCKGSSGASLGTDNWRPTLCQHMGASDEDNTNRSGTLFLI